MARSSLAYLPLNPLAREAGVLLFSCFSPLFAYEGLMPGDKRRQKDY